MDQAWRNFYQFHQDVAEFNRGIADFRGAVSQIQAEIYQEMYTIRAAVQPLRVQSPTPMIPVRDPQQQREHSHQVAMSQFWQRGGRLWYWTSHGLIFVGTLLGGNALLHPFEPALHAWLYTLLGR